MGQLLLFVHELLMGCFYFSLIIFYSVPGTDDIDGDNMNIGTDVDKLLDNSEGKRMESESPSSELEHLGDHSSDNDSVVEAKYEVNPEDPLDVVVNSDSVMETSVDSSASMDIGKENISDNVESVKSDSTEDQTSADSKEPLQKKQKKDRRVTDSFLTEKPSSDVGRLNETFSGSRPSSAASSGKSGSPSKEIKGKLNMLFDFHAVFYCIEVRCLFCIIKLLGIH